MVKMAQSKPMSNDPCWEGYEMVGWKRVGGKRVPNCVPSTKKSMPCCPEETIEDIVIEKADGYTPTAGMKAAARRALRWKQEGKAKIGRAHV